MKNPNQQNKHFKGQTTAKKCRNIQIKIKTSRNIAEVGRKKVKGTKQKFEEAEEKVEVS